MVQKKKPVVVVEEPQEDPRIINMREMTQQLLIIDSIVTDKASFLSHYQLSAETGRLTTTGQFLGHDADGHAFINEMGNKAYFSLRSTSSNSMLYTSDKLGDTWSEPTLLQGLGSITEADYPFMMNDGITFYFAAKGEESIGGYDIFLTRYDSHSGSFLKPENIGMPFNSEANDYMLAIDEDNRIGYFVSDRRQPEGKVCIYIFVPSEVRRTYNPSSYSNEKIRAYAEILRIADTWGNGIERRAALTRLASIKTETPEQKTEPSGAFIVNDSHLYADARDFRSAKAANLYKQLLTFRKQLEKTEAELEKARNYYAQTGISERNNLRQIILSQEEETLRLRARIKTLEKDIRYNENSIINKKQ